MGAVIAVFDSNILIDLLRGFALAADEIDRYEIKEISVITWMEVLAGVPPERQASIREMLGRFRKLPITDAIAEQAVVERRNRKIKLPDAILIATAMVRGGRLVTRNTKDFPKNEKYVRIPYRLTLP